MTQPPLKEEVAPTLSAPEEGADTELQAEIDLDMALAAAGLGKGVDLTESLLPSLKSEEKKGEDSAEVKQAQSEKRVSEKLSTLIKRRPVEESYQRNPGGFAHAADIHTGISTQPARALEVEAPEPHPTLHSIEVEFIEAEVPIEVNHEPPEVSAETPQELEEAEEKPIELSRGEEKPQEVLELPIAPASPEVAAEVAPEVPNQEIEELKKELAELQEKYDALQRQYAEEKEAAHVEAEVTTERALLPEERRRMQAVGGVNYFADKWERVRQGEYDRTLDYGVNDIMTPHEKNELRQRNRIVAVAAEAGVIGAALDGEFEVYNKEYIISALDTLSLPEDKRSAVLEVAMHRIGLAVTQGLNEQQFNEYEAIVNNNRDVIDAWLEQQAPQYMDSSLYKSFAEGYHEDPERNDPEKLFADIAWIRMNVENLQDKVDGALAQVKQELATTVRVA